MKITKTTTVFATAAAAVGFLSAAIASADSATDVTTQPLGSQGKLVDGNVVQGWTISNLRTSSDAIPYPVVGTLWEATATDEAIEGGATPIVSNLNARARSGETYRALFQVPTAEGVNPSTLAQGQKTTGKVYFDVTGDAPDSVVYNAGGQDLLLWVQPPPAPRTGTRPTQYPSSSGRTTAAPAASPGTPAPGAPTTTPAPAAATATPVPGAPVPAATETVPGALLPAGSQGTPLPAGSQGTPLPAQGAPAAEGTPAPQPASTGAPQQAGSQGTPAAPATPVTTVPPAPAG